MSGSMFETNYTAGGRLDAPFYPSFTVPFNCGMKGSAIASSTAVLEYVVPFYGELFAIGFDTSYYQNDDNWDLEVDGEKICEKIFVKRAPEGIALQAFIPVAPGTKIKFTFRNVGGDKEIWSYLQFLKEGSIGITLPTQPPGGLSPITVNQPVIRLALIDDGDEDGDVLNVYLNGAQLVSELNLRHDKNPANSVLNLHYIEIPLSLGDNEIVFEGVSPGAPDSPLTAKFRVSDKNWNVLYEVKDLPDLRMPKGPVDSSQRYLSPRPSVKWVVNRTI